MLNNSNTNVNIEKYENLIYQKAETEFSELVLEEIELIIKGFKNLKAPEENKINQDLFKLNTLNTQITDY